MSPMFVKQWLERYAHTTNNRELDDHLDLISEQINLLDEPRNTTMDYSHWVEQCREWFETETGRQVSYQEMRIKAMSPARVMFIATETIRDRRGPACHKGLEFIIQREEDGKWRAVQQRVLPPQQT